MTATGMTCGDWTTTAGTGRNTEVLTGNVRLEAAVNPSNESHSVSTGKVTEIDAAVQSSQLINLKVTANLGGLTTAAQENRTSRIQGRGATAGQDVHRGACVDI